MTHDLVTAEAPRVQRSPLMAGGRPQPIVPQSMEDCFRLANAVCEAEMAPAGLNTPAKAMVAIMHGLEIGLTPMAALQRIAVVNGRPTIWGDGAMSLVRASGLCEYVSEVIEGQGDKRVAVCEAMRKGERAPVRRTFSVDDAKRAGLWDTREKVRRKSRNSGEFYEATNDAPWYRYPERMLAMRARAFCLRDGFADVLGGLYLKEELDNGEDDRGSQRRAPSPSVAPMIEAQSAEIVPQSDRQAVPAEQAGQPRRAPSPGTLPVQQAVAAEPSKPAPQQQALQYDPEKVRKRFVAEAAKAANTDELNDAWNDIIDPIHDVALAPDQEDWNGIFKARWAELTGGAEP